MKSGFREFLIRKLKSRTFIAACVFVLLFSLLLGRVFYLQIVKGEAYLSDFTMQILKTQEVKSTRGNIYDRNGNLLAYNELAYAVTIEDTGAFDTLTNNEKNNALNGIIQKTLAILDENGDTPAAYFDITVDETGRYAFTDEEGTARNRFIADVYGEKSFEDLSEEQQNATAEDIMAYITGASRYYVDIEALGKEEALRIVNIRYAMSQTSYTKYLVTTVAKDVSDETVAAVKENAGELEGVSVTEDSLRRYNDAAYFASIIGYTGVISTEEYESLSAEADTYSLNDIVGKAGIEQVMDETLQGKKGEKSFYVDSMGNILQTVSETEPEAGNNVYLTIDRDLQIAAYTLLEQKLAGIVYEKLIPSLTYDARSAQSTSQIAIPIGDVYINMFENMVLDTDAFAQAAEGSVQRTVAETFAARQAARIAAVSGEVVSAAGTVAGQGEEMEALLRYVVDLLTDKGIFNDEAIDETDATYLAYQNEGSVSLSAYLLHAVSQNWVDTNTLYELTGLSEKYTETEALLQAVSAYVAEYLPEDAAFSRLLYRYMVLDGSISGTQVALMLYEQGVLAEDAATVANLSSGATTPYDFFRAKIKSLELTPAQVAVEPCTASCVVVDPDNGEVLACVSYPGYDNNRLSNTMDAAYYNRLLNEKSEPLYNHATQERTAPGSTYKMLSAYAGLEAGILDASRILLCDGEFDSVTPSPKCWIYPGAHGGLDVSTAIARSCNCFFFEVGYELGQDEDGAYSSSSGIAALSAYAKDFGLDAASGVEIAESDPKVSDTDSVRSAIGQGTNAYTSTQLARYVAAIANKGTVYNLSLLDKVTDPEENLVENFFPAVYNEITTTEENWTLIQSGMERMVNNSSQFRTLNAEGFSVSGKTGTAQQSELHADHCLFVGYAPSEAPEMAFCIRIANGYTSSYAAEIAQELVQYYFDLEDEETLLHGEASSLGEDTLED